MVPIPGFPAPSVSNRFAVHASGDVDGAGRRRRRLGFACGLDRDFFGRGAAKAGTSRGLVRPRTALPSRSRRTNTAVTSWHDTKPKLKPALTRWQPLTPPAP